MLKLHLPYNHFFVNLSPIHLNLFHSRFVSHIFTHLIDTPKANMGQREYLLLSSSNLPIYSYIKLPQLTYNF